MKKFALIVSAVILVGTTSSLYADMLPYLGGEPYNGSYWNGPLADYGNPAALGSGAYAQATCRSVRTRSISASGRVHYRAHRVCV